MQAQSESMFLSQLNQIDPDSPDEPHNPRISRRALLRAGLGATSLALGGLTWSNRIEPNRLSVERHTLHLPRLPRAFDGFTIAHLSDFHWDEEPNPDRLHSVVETINALSPDLVALTGDYVSHDPRPVAAIMSAALCRLRAPHGVWAVLGNHDQWHSELVRRMLHRGGVHELRNAVEALRRGQSTLYLCGIDSITRGQGDFARVVSALKYETATDDSSAAILLAHEPDFADISARGGDFDLQLSGHSHGGQIRLPGCGPLLLPTHGRKYHSGLYRIENARGAMLQYTNRGLGTVAMRLRFCCPPEISLLQLTN